MSGYSSSYARSLFSSKCRNDQHQPTKITINGSRYYGDDDGYRYGNNNDDNDAPTRNNYLLRVSYYGDFIK